jgi:hypothetical protein
MLFTITSICTNKSSDDKEYTIVNQETVVTPQNTVTPQVTRPVYTENLKNSLSTICTRDNDINDTTT